MHYFVEAFELDFRIKVSVRFRNLALSCQFFKLTAIETDFTNLYKNHHITHSV